MKKTILIIIIISIVLYGCQNGIKFMESNKQILPDYNFKEINIECKNINETLCTEKINCIIQYNENNKFSQCLPKCNKKINSRYECIE